MNWSFAFRVIAKAAILFIILNILFALLSPLESLGRLSLYNTILPGRERLPYGENPAQSYNISLFNIPAMFASHTISQPKAEDEYRVLLIGDSGTWGWYLENEDTLAGKINTSDATTTDGKRIVAYNLGYPIMSLTKDLMLLDYAMQYEPDMVVWLVTLESFPYDKQTFPPIVENNPSRVLDLVERYDLNLDSNQLAAPNLSEDLQELNLDALIRDYTIVGQRRELADLLRLQLYGFSWMATGIDQHIPAEYDLRASDFEADISWQDYTDVQPLTENELAFDVLVAGHNLVGDIPLLIVNEPMFISDGENNNLRYNAFYPRWAYDAYHELLIDTAQANNWHFVDAWDALPPDEFTDTPVHYSPEGAELLAQILLPEIQRIAPE